MSEIDADLLAEADDLQPNLPFNVYKCKEIIHDNLLSSGQRDMLKRMIQNRLAQAGWTYALKMECIQYIKRRGSEDVNVAHMIEDIHNTGREMIPDEVRKELFTFLHDFAKTYVNVDESAPPPDESDVSDPNSFTFSYQNRDTIPDPGLGVGVVSSTTDDSNSNSASDTESSSPCSSPSLSPNESSPRCLTPQTCLPILLPEILDEDPESEEETECEAGDVEGEDCEIEPEEEEDEESSINTCNNEDDQEDLMDV